MEKHKHSIRYSQIHLQLTGIVLFTLFYFVPLTTGIYASSIYLFDGGLPARHDTVGWLLVPVYLFVTFYGMLLLHILLVGITYRLVPNPTIGENVPTYSSDWLRWGIKSEIWKMTSDVPLIFSVILKAYSLRFLLFKLIGLKIHNTSIIVTDVRVYDPHLLQVGKNVLLPVYSIFSGHIITGNTMYMQKIIIGDNVSVGASSGFAPGVTIGDNVTLGFSTLMGKNVKIGSDTMIDSRSSFADDVTIGSHVFIGKNCFFGRKAQIGDGLRLPDNLFVPAKKVIKDKKDLLAFLKEQKASGL